MQQMFRNLYTRIVKAYVFIYWNNNKEYEQDNINKNIY